MNKYDIIIIGGGTGGYRSAEYLAYAKKSVLLFEKHKIGGVCLNYGCIPTKAYISVCEMIESFKMSERFGIKSNYTSDFEKIFSRKERIVKTLTAGLGKKLAGMGVEIKNEECTMLDEHRVKSESGEFYAENIIIATGSIDTGLKGIEFDSDVVLNSKDILGISVLPAELAIVGAGVIGVEMATVFAYLGVKTTLVEYLEKPLAMTQSSLIMNESEKIIKKMGVNLLLNKFVETIDKKEHTLKISNGEKIHFDKLLIATGRRSVVNYDAKNIGIEIDSKGFIPTDNEKRTNIKNIYAVGDVTNGPMLAHKAYYDALTATNSILNKRNNHLDYEYIPYSIFTIPSISHCGLTEDICIKRNIKYRKIESGYAENGRAATYEARQGSCTLLLDENEKILGATIIGKESDILIHEILPLMHNGLDLSYIARTVHIHPTLSEIVGEITI